MEDYVTYEQALRLKELGFDWECNHIYKKDFFNQWIFFHCLQDAYRNHNQGEKSEPIIVSAPTLSQAHKWLREVKGIYVEISRYHLNNFAYELKFDYDSNHKYCCQAYMTPEEALLRGIDEALELLK